MNRPDIKITAISNVYTRLMHFKNNGDVEHGHSHAYDHGTLLSKGSVLYEVLDAEDGKVVKSKIFHAPGYIFVEKNKFHRITALEDDTVCTCIHALRDVNEDIIDPESFIDPVEQSEELVDLFKDKLGAADAPLLVVEKPKRTCDGCTKCCEGHLDGVAHGHNFQKGKPCFYLSPNKGCSIYMSRPEDPCRKFQCAWLSNDVLPMWMRPDLSNVIVTTKNFDDGEWIQVVEAGKKIDSSVLSWLLIWAANEKLNIRYQVDGGWYWIKNKPESMETKNG